MSGKPFKMLFCIHKESIYGFLPRKIWKARFLTAGCSEAHRSQKAALVSMHRKEVLANLVFKGEEWLNFALFVQAGSLMEVSCCFFRQTTCKLPQNRTLGFKDFSALAGTQSTTSYLLHVCHHQGLYFMSFAYFGWECFLSSRVTSHWVWFPFAYRCLVSCFGPHLILHRFWIHR